MRVKTLLSFALLALLCGCKAPKPASLHIDQALENLIPPDTTFLLEPTWRRFATLRFIRSGSGSSIFRN